MSSAPTHRPRCFFDVDVDGQNAGRVVFELFSDVTPKTCENFRALCTGEKGVSEKSEQPLHYRGTPFHRIVKDFMIQGGDFTKGDGTGGESIYGGQFADENFIEKHGRDYLLSMANRGKDTNGSQFFITTKPAPHLDGKHVVFGRVISGQELVKQIENLDTDKKNRPSQPVSIANSGELVLQLKAKAKKKKKVEESEETDTVESSSDSESSSSEHEKKKKKKKKKEKKKSKKKKKEKKKKKQKQSSSEDEGELKKEEESSTVFGNIRPEEIPSVPSNKFLSRDRQDLDVPPVKELPPRENSRSRIRYTSSGGKIKGRGTVRYHRSWSRERSATPPHWRREQQRLKPRVQDNRDAPERWTRGERMEREQPDRMSRVEMSMRGDARDTLGRREMRGQPDPRERSRKAKPRSESEEETDRRKDKKKHKKDKKHKRSRRESSTGGNSDLEVSKRNGDEARTNSRKPERIDLRDRIRKRQSEDDRLPATRRGEPDSSSEEGEIHELLSGDKRAGSGDESETEKLRKEALASRTKVQMDAISHKAQRHDSGSSESEHEVKMKSKKSARSSSSESEPRRKITITSKRGEAKKRELKKKSSGKEKRHQSSSSPEPPGPPRAKGRRSRSKSAGRRKRSSSASPVKTKRARSKSPVRRRQSPSPVRSKRSRSPNKRSKKRSRSASREVRRKRSSSSSNSRSRSRDARRSAARRGRFALQEPISAKYGFKRRSSSHSSRSRSRGRYASRSTSRDRRRRNESRRDRGIDRKKLEEAARMARIKSESPPPTHWKPGQKPWKPKGPEAEQMKLDKAVIPPVTPYVGASIISPAGELDVLQGSPVIDINDIEPGSPPKQGSKSDVLPDKIQYHLDDPNVTARPIKVTEKRTKTKRSRSMSSESTKSRSSRNSVSSRSRSRSRGKSITDAEEQGKEKEKKKFEERIKWQPPPDPEDIDRDDHSPVTPQKTNVALDVDEASRSSLKTPPLPTIAQVAEAASQMARKKRGRWDSSEQVVKVESKPDTPVAEVERYNPDSPTKPNYSPGHPPIASTLETASPPQPPLPCESQPPLPPTDELPVLMKQHSELPKLPAVGEKAISSVFETIGPTQIGVVKPMAILPKIINADIPMPPDEKAAQEETSADKQTKDSKAESVPTTEKDSADKERGGSKTSRPRSKSRSKSRDRSSSNRKRSPAPRRKRSPPSPKRSRKRTPSPAPRKSRRSRSPRQQSASTRSARRSSRSPKRLRKRSSSGSVSPRRYSPIPPRRRSRSPRRRRTRSPRRRSRSARRSRSPRRRYSRSRSRSRNRRQKKRSRTPVKRKRRRSSSSSSASSSPSPARRRKRSPSSSDSSRSRSSRNRRKKSSSNSRSRSRS